MRSTGATHEHRARHGIRLRRRARCADRLPAAHRDVLPGARLRRAVRVGALRRGAVPAAARSRLSACRVALVTTAAPYQPDKGDQGPGAPYNARREVLRASIPATRAIDHDLRISHVAIDRQHTTAEDRAASSRSRRCAARAAAGRIGAMAPRFHGAPTNRSQRTTLDSRRARDRRALPRRRASTRRSSSPTARSATRRSSLAARLLERAASPRVVMGCAKDIVEHVGVPRFLFSDFPLGNAAGRPHDVASQDVTLDLALRVLEAAPAARTTVQSPLRWSDSADWKLDYCNIERLTPEEIAAVAPHSTGKAQAKRLRESLRGERTEIVSDPEPRTDLTERLQWSAGACSEEFAPVVFPGAHHARLSRQHRSYAKVIANSKRVRWEIEARCPARAPLRLRKPSCPTACRSSTSCRSCARVTGACSARSRAAATPTSSAWWSASSAPRCWTSAGSTALGDQVALEALVRMTDEEIKHQELFRRLEAMMAADMPAGYVPTADPNAVAAAVLGKSTWAVLALTLRHRAVHAGALPRQHRRREDDICAAVERRVPVPLERGVAARGAGRDRVPPRGRRLDAPSATRPSAT